MSRPSKDNVSGLLSCMDAQQKEKWHVARKVRFSSISQYPSWLPRSRNSAHDCHMRHRHLSQGKAAFEAGLKLHNPVAGRCSEAGNPYVASFHAVLDDTGLTHPRCPTFVVRYGALFRQIIRSDNLLQLGASERCRTTYSY